MLVTEMLISAQSFGATNATLVVSLRCPGCRQQGIFQPLAQDVQISPGSVVLAGMRRCPNPSCGAIVFFGAHASGSIAVSYPAERLEFDTTNLPAPVTNALEEAVTCHANQCFIAAAIMVRKTLEELCRDRAATGSNLKERLKNLGTKIVLPQELLDGLDDLRLLGNDAAHIESQEFDKVGREEVEVGIEFAREVLKAVYQYSALLTRLRALKK
jgi:HEPN domain-containing protein